MFSPIEAGFREWNHSKIVRLTEANCSDETIASSINDEMKQKGIEDRFTAGDITSYKKVTDVSGNVSLVSEKKVKALTGNGGAPQPT